MSKITIATAALLVLGGCATVPVPTGVATPVPSDRLLSSAYAQPGPDKGSLIVKRDSGFLGGACATRIYLNGGPVAEIRTSESITLHVQAGEHIVSAQPGSICAGAMVEAAAVVKAGQTLTFRVGYGNNGDFGLYRTAF